MSRPLQGIPCRLLQIPYCPFVVFPLFKVYCQLSRNLTCSTSISFLKPFADPYIKLLTLPDRNSLVPEVLIQRMAEPIASGAYSIRPLPVSQRSQKVLPTCESLTTLFYLCCIDADSSSHCCGGKLLTSDAGCLHHLLLFTVE